MSYPTTLDTLSNPGANDTQAAVPHATQHTNANDAIEALEAKVGTYASVPAINTRLMGHAAGASKWVPEHSFPLSYFGILPDVGDVTALLLQAIADVPQGTELVQDRAGIYSVGKITVNKSFIRFRNGGGVPRHNHVGAQFKLLNSTNDSMFYVPLTSYGVEFEGLAIDGNKANQTGTSHGIEYQDGDGVPGSDARHVGPALRRLLITSCLTNGLYGGRSNAGMMIDGIEVIACGQDGIRLGGDTDMLTNFLISECDRYGLVIDGPSASISNFAIWENLVGVRLNAAGALGSGAESTQLINGSIDDNDQEGEWIEDNVYWTSHTNVHYHHNSKVATGLHAHVYYAGSSFATTPSFGGCKFYGAASPTTKYDYEIASATGFIREDATTVHYGYYTTGVSNRIGNIHQTVLGELLPSQYSDDTAGAVIRSRKSRHIKPNQHTILQANDVLFDDIHQGSDGTTFRTAGLQRWQVDSAPSSGIVPGRYSLYTTDAAGVLTERLRVDSAGAADLMYGLRLSNVISPPQITGNTDNYAPTGLAAAVSLRLSTDASRNLTGMTAGTAGDMKLICNVGAFDLVLKHDATSTGPNRFLCPGSADFTLNANDSVWIRYDGTSARWRVIGF